MQVVALVGQKGGSGKTTIATSLASHALGQGLAVLLVDADPQGSTATWAEVGNETASRKPTGADGYPPSVLRLGANMHRELAHVAHGYELVVIDCPPRHGEIQRSALMAADLALLPCGPSAADVWALAESIELVKVARGLRRGLDARIVMTRKQAHTALGQAARKALASTGVPVLRTELGYRVAYQEAIGAGLGVAAYAPTSTAAREIARLFHEVRGVLHGKKTSEHRNTTKAAGVR